MNKKLLFIFLSTIICKTIIAQFTEIINFNGSNGTYPHGSFTQIGHTLYGMTEDGGNSDSGTIFSIDTSGLNYRKLFDFGSLNGARPCGDLTYDNGTFYGLTAIGGKYNCGCIFSIDTDGTGFTVLHNFNDSAGEFPYGSLVISGGVAYGMTYKGGKLGTGCLFSINTNGTAFQDIINFTNNNFTDTGAYPNGSLTISGGWLYGMTYGGGGSGEGIIFKIQTNGAQYTDLHNCYSSTGDYPEGNLTLIGNKLFGMMYGGGVYNSGVIFSMNTDGSSYKILYNFDFQLGYEPYGSLTFSGNKFYGMTYYGGPYGYGNLFAVDTNGSNYEDLYEFDYFNSGYHPIGDVTVIGKEIFGMVFSGGIDGYGIAYKFDTCTLALSTSITQITCHGSSNGIIQLSTVGGSKPYTYSWSTGDTGTSISGLSIGTYSISVENSCSVTKTTSVTITQPTVLTVTVSSHTNSCNGNLGNATATVSGGTSPYAYQWLPYGGINSIASNLSAGTYTIIATDHNGCTATSSFVNKPVSITISSKLNVPCFGGTGKIIANPASGGTLPYTYSWSPSGGTNLTASNLLAGIYTITVTDHLGCKETAVDSITQPLSPLTISISSDTNPICYGGTGTVTGDSATGGWGHYTYSWFPSGGTNLTVTGLSAGTYTIHVTDSNGCLVTAAVTITQPTLIVPVISVFSSIKCNGDSNGILSSTATGGSGFYSYQWSDASSQTNAVITGLSASTYTVKVTDNNGCIGIDSFNLIQPGILKDSVPATFICLGNWVNLIDYTTGGTTPYHYSWNTGSTSDSIRISPIVNTFYKVTTIDSNGCRNADSVTVFVKPVPTVNIVHPNPDSVCNTISTVTLNANPPGGVFSGIGIISNVFYPDSANSGNFNVFYYTFTDTNGCSSTAKDSIFIRVCTGVQQLSVVSSQWSVKPNPSDGEFVILGLEKDMQVEIYNCIGEKIETECLPSLQTSPFSIDLRSKSNGVYLIRVTQEGLLVGQKKIIINR